MRVQKLQLFGCNWRDCCCNRFLIALVLLNALVEQVQVLRETEDGDERGNVFGEVFLLQEADLSTDTAVDTTSDFVV